MQSVEQSRVVYLCDDDDGDNDDDNAYGEGQMEMLPDTETITIF